MKNLRFGPDPEARLVEAPRENDPFVSHVRQKASHVGAPAIFALELACRQLHEAFADEGPGGIYLVGSALARPDWRDIDVRFILEDETFAKLFPAAGVHWEHDARWLIMTTAISTWLGQQTGLPIDFQFQPRTHANDRHSGPRNALGMIFMRTEPDVM